VLDNSGGFLLPDRSGLSPDASLVGLERCAARWVLILANGAQLGWLLIPE